jgi:hypothetical protein
MNIDDDVLFHHMWHIKDYLELFDQMRYYVTDIEDFDYMMNEHRNQQMMKLLKDYLLIKLFSDFVLMVLDHSIMKIRE